MIEEAFHTPVLLNEVISGLRVKPGKKYIDATLGGGGHAIEIVKRGGIVLGIDVDQEALDYVEEKIRSANLADEIRNLTLVRGNYRDIGEIARKNGFEKVAGIVFDLGVSSHQLKTTERGFSFQQDASLDMRMDQTLTVRASDLVNGLYEHELTDIFKKYGEERRARTIAYTICRAREVNRIERTIQLADIIARVIPRIGRLHPATKIFQALRIAVNDELGSLERGLSSATELIENGGRIAVISFHSLEDRLVKRAFVRHQTTKKPIIPTDEEVALNPRSRSGKLRIFENN